jgi:HPt (histidine-containing phosphotransfer) domain-containing protein
MTTHDSATYDPIGSELVEEDASFADIVIQFVDGLAGRLETMENALRGANFEALRAAAHQLKGSGGGYGYPILTELAAKLEAQAKARAYEGCVAELNQLRNTAKRVVVSADP